MLTSRRSATIVAVTVCAATLCLAYLNKARCAGPPFDLFGRSMRFDTLKDAQVCYSDIQQLWIGRGINLHRFPFVDGGINAAGQLTGGTVEYPVLGGILMWLGAVFAHTDAEFLLYSALLLAPFGLATAFLLGRMAGARALWWSATPPLVLYAFLNWDLPVVAVTVAAVAVVGVRRWPVRARGIAAAVLLAVGFCLKLYPGLFVLPLLLFVFTGGEEGGRRDPRGAVAVAAAAVGTVVAVNLPFAILGYEGWRASFEFQQNRTADATTNSVWYWGLRPLMGGYQGHEVTAEYNGVVSLASPILMVAAFAVALWFGWRRYLDEGTYPWLEVSAAMLCAFLLLHKVHSPQYTLWLLPLLILTRIPWQLVAAYLVVDLSMGIGIFRWFDATAGGGDESLPLLLVGIGVWGRAIGLAVLFVVFLHPPRRGARADRPDADTDHRLTSAGDTR